MDLFTLIKVVFRRWYVVVPVGLLTLGLAYYVQTNVPPEYEATGWLAMETPELDGSGGPTGAIDPVRLSEGIELDDGDFTVTPIEEGRFGVAVSAETAQAADDGVEHVIEQLGQSIASLQEDNGTPEGQRVELRMASPDIVAEEQEDSSYVAQVSMYLYSRQPVTPNPYGLNEGTVTLLRVAVTGQAARQRFVELAGPGVGYNVVLEDDGGLLQVVTTGSDERRVLEAFHVVQTLVAEELASRQGRAGVDPSQQITVGVVDAPLAASDVSPPVNRAVAGVLGLGGLLALGLAVGVEGLSRRKVSAHDEPALEDDRASVEPGRGVGGDASESIPAEHTAQGDGGDGASTANRDPAGLPAEDGPRDVGETPSSSFGTSSAVTEDTEQPNIASPASVLSGRPEGPRSAVPGSDVAEVEAAPDLPATARPERAVASVAARGHVATNGERRPDAAHANGVRRGRSLPPGRLLVDPVPSETVNYSSERGPVRGHLALPSSGSGPGVVVIQEWWGLTDHIKRVTDRLAAEGFVALSPDLYGDGTTTNDPERAASLMQELPVDRAVADLSASVDFLLDHPAVTSTSVGAVGFSMGGGLVLVLAAHQGERIGAAVPYYGVGGYDQVDLSRVSAPVLGHFGAEDVFASPEAAHALEVGLKEAASADVTIHVHPGAGHFFANDDDDFETHDVALSAATWRETVSFLWERLT